MSFVTWIHEFNAAPAGALPNVFRYVLGTSGLHQLFLLALTVGVFLLEVVPLELQRRIVNDLVKHRPFSWVVSLCAVYAGIVLVQGGTKLALNIYRGWVGERAKRDLPRRVHTFVETPDAALPAVEAQGIAVSMIVAEVEPIGGWRERLGAALAGRHHAFGAVLSYPHRSVDGAGRVRALRPPARLCSAIAGRGQPAHRSPHPNAPPARYRDD
jgi:hypothetical protein